MLPGYLPQASIDAATEAIGASPIGVASKGLVATGEVLTGEVANAVDAVGQGADKVQRVVDESGVLEVLGSAARSTAGAARATTEAAARAAAAARRRRAAAAEAGQPPRARECGWVAWASIQSAPP